MSSIEIRPHGISDAAFSSQIQVAVGWGGQINAPLSNESLDGWSPSSNLIIQFNILTDSEFHVATSALPYKFRPFLVASCTQTKFRKLISLTRSGDQHFKCEIEIAPGEVQKSILYHWVLIAEEADHSGGQRIQKGEILWKSEQGKIKLDGLGGDFPIESMPFQEDLADAPWRLFVDTTEPEVEIMSGPIRLYLNENHSAFDSIQKAESDSFWLTQLLVDVKIQLVLAAIRDEQLLKRQDYPEGSIGEYLSFLTMSFYSKMQLPKLHDAYEQDALKIHSKLLSSIKQPKMSNP